MIVLPPPTSIRPADDIAAMLRQLADDLESNDAINNVFLVLEWEDDSEPADVRCFGPCDDAFRAAGMLTKAARDVLP